jgi:hypothetical protein
MAWALINLCSSPRGYSLDLEKMLRTGRWMLRGMLCGTNE